MIKQISLYNLICYKMNKSEMILMLQNLNKFQIDQIILVSSMKLMKLMKSKMLKFKYKELQLAVKNPYKLLVRQILIQVIQVMTIRIIFVLSILTEERLNTQTLRDKAKFKNEKKTNNLDKV